MGPEKHPDIVNHHSVSNKSIMVVGYPGQAAHPVIATRRTLQVLNGVDDLNQGFLTMAMTEHLFDEAHDA
jgi:hypothetical protein